MKLHRYFNNPFLSREISNLELQVFTEDHLAKLSAASGAEGIFADMILATASAYTAYFGELTNVSLRNAVRKAATFAMKGRWRDLVIWMTTKGAARIIDKAGKDSAVYTEFFPQGHGEYHSARVAGIQAIAKRIKASALEHVALLGADFQAKVDGLASDFESARGLQMEMKGAATDTRGNRDEKKAVLQMQLFKNLLAIAALEMDGDRASLYFSQHLLEDRQRPDGGNQDG